MTIQATLKAAFDVQKLNSLTYKRAVVMTVLTLSCLLCKLQVIVNFNICCYMNSRRDAM